MNVVGQILTAVGVLCILLPILGVILDFTGTTLPYVIEYAPTFVLGGIVLFVVGVAIRTFAS